MSVASVVPLYRVENPTLPFNQPEGDYFKSELAGQWFDLYLDGAIANFGRVSLLSYRYGAPAQLAIAQIPSHELEKYNASYHSVASRMAHFGDDYIIPRDGSVAIAEIDIDEAARIRDYDRIYDIAADAVRRLLGRGLIISEGRVR